jgi:hypothetical protein
MRDKIAQFIYDYLDWHIVMIVGIILKIQENVNGVIEKILAGESAKKPQRS